MNERTAVEWGTRAAHSEAERVAYVDRLGVLVELENVHELPRTGFRVSPTAWAMALDRAALIVHTHPSGQPTPSVADLRGQIASGVPWVIAPRNGAAFVVGSREPKPLEGRGYRFGDSDCYGLFRAAYADYSGTWLPDFPRAWGFWRRGEMLFEENVAAAGFSSLGPSIDQARRGDALLFRIRSEIFNHVAFYAGGGKMLHHPAPRLPFDPTRVSRSESVDRWVASLNYEVFRRGS